ncbi:MAG: GHKL domain-containing protein [Christensenellaceae bacterium]
MCILLKIDLSDKKKLLLSIVIFAIGFVGILLLCMWTGIDAVLGLMPVVILIPLYLTFWFISVYKGLKLLFVLLTSSVLMFLPGLLGVAVSEMIDNEIVMSIASILVIIGTIALLIKFFRPKFLFILQTVDAKGYWLAICLIPILYNAAVYLLGLYNQMGNATPLFFQLILMGMVMAAYLLIILTFTQIKKRTEMERIQDLTDMQIKTAYETIEQMQELQNQATIYQHDLKHHIQMIHSYLNNQKQDKLKNYLKEIEDEAEETVFMHYCKNQVIDLILCMYANKAKKAGVQFEIAAEIPEEILVREKDICVVLSNAFENALKATENIEEEDRKKISFCCKTKNNRLTFLIENAYDGEIKFEDGLPKASSAGHGLGTQSIAAITKKYNGLCSFEAKDGIFYLKLVI